MRPTMVGAFYLQRVADTEKPDQSLVTSRTECGFIRMTAAMAVILRQSLAFRRHDRFDYSRVQGRPRSRRLRPATSLVTVAVLLVCAVFPLVAGQKTSPPRTV